MLIIEDHEDFRSTVKSYLEMQEIGLEIFEADSGELGIIKALREQPHIVLMDIRLPGISGIEAAGRIKGYLPKCDIIVLTMFETVAFKKVFKSDNIAAYIGKSELYDKLVPVIQKLLGKNQEPKKN